MKGIRILFAISWTLLALGAIAVFGFSDSDATESESEQATTKTAEQCQAPQWAIAIGHEQMWKLHNGCPTDDQPTDKD